MVTRKTTGADWAQVQSRRLMAGMCDANSEYQYDYFPERNFIHFWIEYKMPTTGSSNTHRGNPRAK
jgi:hypothetical protein